MRILFIAALPLIAAPLAACSFDGSDHNSKPGVAGSGSGTTRTYAVSDFTGVDLRGSDDVDVRVGSGFSVRAEGPSEELDKLKVERDGATLKVGRVNNSGFHWGSGEKNAVKIYVTMPRIADASIAGSGDMSIDRVEGQDFSASTAGSGDLSVGTIGVQTGKFSIAGSGSMTLAGTVRDLSVDIAGSGDVDAGGVKSEAASVSVAGSGNVRAAVTGPAKVNVMGSGDVDLGTGAKCTTSKMGSGEVKCG